MVREAPSGGLIFRSSTSAPPARLNGHPPALLPVRVRLPAPGYRGAAGLACRDLLALDAAATATAASEGLDRLANAAGAFGRCRRGLRGNAAFAVLRATWGP